MLILIRYISNGQYATLKQSLVRHLKIKFDIYQTSVIKNLAMIFSIWYLFLRDLIDVLHRINILEHQLSYLLHYRSTLGSVFVYIPPEHI